MSDSGDTDTRPLPWQQELWTGWLRQLKAGRLPHAVLISGIAGLGKGHLADVFAQAVLCTAKPENRPCGQCKSCQLLKAGSHPDLRRVEPEEAGKAIKIAQVRELVDSLGGTAQQGGWKCVIIRPADAMNSHAANALLKSLEEPPGDTLMILVTSSPSQLMATLRSRCRQIQVLPPSREGALAWLEPRVGDRASELLAYAHGAPCAALAASEKDSLTGRREIFDFLLGLAGGQGGTVETAKAMQNFAGMEAVDQLLDLIGQLARGRLTGLTAEPLPEQWLIVLDRIDPQLLFRYRDKLIQAKGLLLSGANPNKQLLWEELMFDWQALAANRATPKSARPRL